MPNKTLYVGPRQTDVWERAEALAAERGVSLSSLVTRALREHLDRTVVSPDGTGDDHTPVTLVTGETLERLIETVDQRLDGLEQRIERLEASTKDAG